MSQQKPRLDREALKNNIQFARMVVERQPVFTESLGALREVRVARKSLEKSLGIKSKNLGAAFTAALQAQPPAASTAEAAKAELFSQKKASEAFGLLDSLLEVKEEARLPGILWPNRKFALAKMDNSHRLTVLRKVEERLEKSVLLELSALRQKRKPSPPGTP